MKLSQVIIVIIGIVLLGGLFFIFKPKTQNTSHSNTNNASPVAENPTPSPTTKSNTFELVIQSKKLVSGSATIKVTQGEDVTIKITSDEGEEFHVHAYDKSVELEPGKQATLTFTADLSGRFPFELENSKTEIGTLEVQPK